MIARLFGIVLAALAGTLFVTLAVINRHVVPFVLDPFNPARPAVSVELPFYAYLFAMLIIGVVLGGVATWFTQGKWRRLARVRTQEALRWKGEADRLTRERDDSVAEQKVRTLTLAKR